MGRWALLQYRFPLALCMGSLTREEFHMKEEVTMLKVLVTLLKRGDETDEETL